MIPIGIQSEDDEGRQAEMCLAKAYLSKEAEKPVLQDIQQAKVDGDSIVLKTLFGEQTTIKGRILSIDFAGSRLIIEEQASRR